MSVARITGGRRRNKHNAQRVEVDGVSFASKAEGARYIHLKTLERKGSITDLVLHPVYELAPAVVLDGRKKPALRYAADFEYRVDGELVVEDVKGMVTKVYRIKKHLMKHIHGIDIHEVKAR